MFEISAKIAFKTPGGAVTTSQEPVPMDPLHFLSFASRD
jgi:hypothetical protein